MNLDNLAKLRSKQYSKASEFVKEQDILSALRPEMSLALPPTGDIESKRAAVRAKLGL